MCKHIPLLIENLGWAISSSFELTYQFQRLLRPCLALLKHTNTVDV